MFQHNFLRIALRRLARQKLNTVLHVAGLSLGMTVCLLIGLFLRHELSFDRYHTKAGRTYRINSIWTDTGQKHFHFSTPMPLAPALRMEAPGVETVAQWHPSWHKVVEINPQKRFKEEHIALADPEILDVFDIEVLRGDGHEALRKPYHCLLTESAAERFFGREDPMGKTFKYGDKFDITVAGIIRDQPANTHFPASVLISFFRDEKFLGNNPDGWSYVSGTSTFVVLPKNADPHLLDAPLLALANKNINADPNMPKHVRSDFDWLSLAQVHFQTKYAGGGNWMQAVNPTWLWFFGVIGLAVLALACINFINLSTAQALTRAKEVGVRKSVGAERRHLVGQFLGEAWLLTGISGVLAIAAAQASLPFLNQLVDKKISFNLLQSPDLLGALLLGMALTGLLAGWYPAWVIAKFHPVAALKTGWSISPFRGAGGSGSGSANLRKGLVVAQFSISAALLMAVALIAQQVNLLRGKDLGFEKDNIVTVTVGGSWGNERKKIFADELAKIPALKGYSFSTASPSDDSHWGTIMSTTNGDDPNRKEVTLILADEKFPMLYDLQLVAGRFLQSADTTLASESLPPEQQIQRVVVNEECVKALGFASAEAALGKPFWFGFNSGKAEIVGVMADFNTTSLHDAIKPSLLLQAPSLYWVAGIEVAGGSDLPKTIAHIRSAWEKAFPQGVFEHRFLDEDIDAFYKTEARLYSLFRLFAGLAMLISCLGLWGLATFAARQRTKEIGIRKVLGASVAGIVGLLSKEFLTLVVVSLVIASPLAWYFMHQWLQDFAYRIDIQWWVFAAAGAAAVGIAFLTVSFQSVRAALGNPVEALRSE